MGPLPPEGAVDGRLLRNELPEVRTVPAVEGLVKATVDDDSEATVPTECDDGTESFAGELRRFTPAKGDKGEGCSSASILPADEADSGPRKTKTENTRLGSSR
jgi:hypothetical protein